MHFILYMMDKSFTADGLTDLTKRCFKGQLVLFSSQLSLRRSCILSMHASSHRRRMTCACHDGRGHSD